MAGVRLRPETGEDLAFLRELYASTREAELAAVPWTDADKRAFLDQQFDAQRRYYRDQMPDAAFDIIEVDGNRVGRLYVDRRDDELRLVDIALLPGWRGQGIGTELLRELMAEAGARGAPLRIHVEKNNPAYRLYRRLGFEVVAGRGVYDLLEWSRKVDE